MHIDKRCALCGKDRTEVKRLILGKHGGICPECVYRCLAILQPDAEVLSERHDAPTNAFAQGDQATTC